MGGNGHQLLSDKSMPEDKKTVHLHNAKADRVEIERAISLLFNPGDVVEVRIPKTRAGVVAGYFDNPTAMTAAICEADAKYRAAGVYYVINEINPALLGRAYNRLKERAFRNSATCDN